MSHAAELAAKVALELLETALKLFKAGDDEAAIEAAIMEQHEKTKAHLDDLKFGPRS